MAQFNHEYGAVLRFSSSLDLILENNYPIVPENTHQEMKKALYHIATSAVLMQKIEKYFQDPTAFPDVADELNAALSEYVKLAGECNESID